MLSLYQSMNKWKISRWKLLRNSEPRIVKLNKIKELSPATTRKLAASINPKSTGKVHSVKMKEYKYVIKEINSVDKQARKKGKTQNPYIQS